MKILLNKNILNNTFNANSNKSTIYYLTKNENMDCFTKSNVSFKANTTKLQQTATKILEDKNLLNKAGQFGAAFFAALIAIATGKQVENGENDPAAFAAEAFITNQGDKNENLNEKIFLIELPKKPGVKPKKIKEIVKINEMKLVLSEEDSIKLKKICEHLLNNKSDEVNSIAVKLSDSLMKAQTDAEKTEVINALHSTIFSKEQDLSSKENSVVEPTQENSSTEFSVKKKRRPRITNNTNIGNKTENVTPKILGHVNLNETGRGIKHRNVILEVEEEDDKAGIYLFRAPGTVSENIEENLKSIWRTFKTRTFKETVENGVTKKTQYMRHPVIEKVTVDDIKREISVRQNQGCPYININKINGAEREIIMEELVDVLNSDEVGFKEVFSLHGALRFIERFVNFNTDVSVEEQCKELLSSLKEAIRVEMGKGMNIEVYQDHKNNLGARIIIKSDQLKNPAGFELGGSFDIYLTMCNGTESNRPVKQIIHTIYSKEI